MNRFLSSLGEICWKYPLNEKLLIASGYRAGHELCECLARDSGGWVNLQPETAVGLAHIVAGEHMAENNLTLLPGNLSFSVIEDVFHKLEEQGTLQYFTREGNYSGIIRAVASSILELRNAGLTGSSLVEDNFVSVKKGQDMAVLLLAYEHFLDEHNLIDVPGLFSLAIELLSHQRTGPKGDILYLLPSFLKLYPLEQQLIELMAGEDLFLLEADPVYGLSRPGVAKPEPDAGQEFTPNTDVDLLPWLYQVNMSPPPVGDGSLDCFHAYGINNEVREIFRRIQKERIPLDKVTIAYTKSDYIPALYTLAGVAGLGITMEEGISVFFTAAGKVLKGLIEWIRNDFPTRDFRDLLLSGDVQLRQGGELSLSPSEAARILRISGIGWGRDRYSLLKTLANGFKEKAAVKVEEDNDGRQERFLRQGEQAFRLHEIMDGILSYLPVPDVEGKVSFRELTSSLASAVAELTRVRGEMDAAALKAVTEDLIAMGKISSFALGMDEALDRVENLFAGYGVGSCGPKPGHIHLASYNHLIWSDRPYTFVVGLDANSFPGSGRQDPVLLDVERAKINSQLPLGIEKPGENQYKMALALASRRGRVTLSFSSFDVVENRLAFPSSLLLQVFRLLERDNTLNYSRMMNFLGKPAGYCSRDGENALDEVEWWLGKALTGPGIRNGPEAVIDCYKGIKLGQKAVTARQNPEPTEYDGVIDPGDVELDPRENKDMIMSCSRIEYLAGCPFAYFLRYVLKIYPPEQITYDPGRWLDALDRGSLLHDLFYKFMCKVKADKEIPSLSGHRKMMMEMADELITNYKRLVPPPNDVVFKREAAEIYTCCEMFLTLEESQTDGSPEFFEVPFGFGTGAAKEAGCGLADPVEVKLDDDTGFLLRGKVDRIDRVRDGVYHVWDYKTGSTYGFDDHKHLCGGRQVQHALYAIAVEDLLKGLMSGETPRVELSGYYFPTEKGEGQKVARQQSDRSSVFQVLNHLFDLLASGCFIAADHGEKCGICDYPDVCNQESALARAKDLLLSGSGPCLNPLRRLKEHD